MVVVWISTIRASVKVLKKLLKSYQDNPDGYLIRIKSIQSPELLSCTTDRLPIEESHSTYVETFRFPSSVFLGIT